MREDRDTTRAGAQQEWMSWMMRITDTEQQPQLKREGKGNLQANLICDSVSLDKCKNNTTLTNQIIFCLIEVVKKAIIRLSEHQIFPDVFFMHFQFQINRIGTVRVVANRKGGNCYQLVSSHIYLFVMHDLMVLFQHILHVCLHLNQSDPETQPAYLCCRTIFACQLRVLIITARCFLLCKQGSRIPERKFCRAYGEGEEVKIASGLQSTMMSAIQGLSILKGSGFISCTMASKLSPASEKTFPNNRSLSPYATGMSFPY
ncbi:hypothetical protein NC653_026915 [Populus alba x Populus x berolinensis]|uniref:Uncharacterized protein n=1 Tax=Populus alba x Populus x berolinensis TaxID=444605 RepID=A0AAD6M4D1_9ROSI|nr:hypothetical protein NC653_026915 [Populus alba x Populus x berolinensis]